MSYQPSEQREKVHWNCQTLLKKLMSSPMYPELRQLLLKWKQTGKQNIAAIDTFIKVSRIIHEEAKDQKLSDYFNKCLIKEAHVTKRAFNFQNEELEQIDQGDNQEIQGIQTSQNKKIGAKKKSKKSEDKNSDYNNDLENMADEEIEAGMESEKSNNVSQFKKQYKKTKQKASKALRKKASIINKDDQLQYLSDQGNQEMSEDFYGLQSLGRNLKNNSFTQSGQVVQNIFNWVKKQSKINNQNVVAPKQTAYLKPDKKIGNININSQFQGKQSEALTVQGFQARLLNHPFCGQLTKIVSLYIKCIINLTEIKSFIFSASQLSKNLGFNDQEFFLFLSKTCQEIETKRRKVTMFAPLNELVDQKYPLQPLGTSYIAIPDGYANYSKEWLKNPERESVMNRKCVSVPLGSEVSFVISKKTDFQEQLFNYEDQRYEIDNIVQCLRASISIIKKAITAYNTSNLSSSSIRIDSPMIKRIVSQLYPTVQNIYSIFINNIEMAETILLPRLQQKHEQLICLRQKFMKVCEEVSAKNFYKSLDYRCFYFAKNDKKYNSPFRWLEQIHLRKKQIIQENFARNLQNSNQTSNQSQNQNQQSQHNQQDPQHQPNQQNQGGNSSEEKLDTTRQNHVNSFENVTTEELLLIPKSYLAQEDRKYDAKYPKFPHNQILFILNFSNLSILQDVLEVLLYHVNANKKKLLEILVFRIMRIGIMRRLKKGYQQTTENYSNNTRGKNFTENQNSNLPKHGISQEQNFSDSFEQSFGAINSLNNSNNLSKNLGTDNALLNQPSLGKPYSANGYGPNNTSNTKDSEEQFLEFIDEEYQNTFISQQTEIPFQGAQHGKSFLGTKPIYLFMRYLLTIYQRFVKAKQYSINIQQQEQEENQEQSYQSYPDSYKHFLWLMTSKIKDKKTLEESLRKLYQNNAFIFFTLQKFILAAVKTINNIGADSLTYKILKDKTRDYENRIYQWESFTFPNIMQQLIRLYEYGANPNLAINTNTTSNNSNNSYGFHNGNNIHAEMDLYNTINKDNDLLFRFTYVSNNDQVKVEPEAKNNNLLYISAWNAQMDSSFANNQSTTKIRNQLNQVIEPQVDKKLLKNKKMQMQEECLFKNEEEIIFLMGQAIIQGNSSLVNKNRFSLPSQQPQKQQEYQARKVFIKSKYESQLQKIQLVNKRFIW